MRLYKHKYINRQCKILRTNEGKMVNKNTAKYIRDENHLQDLKYTVSSKC